MKKSKSFIASLITIASLGMVGKGLSEDHHRGVDDIEDVKYVIDDHYYISLRSKGEKWFGESDSRDFQLLAVYKSYIRDVNERGESKRDFIKKFDYLLPLIKEFVSGVEDFLQQGHSFDSENHGESKKEVLIYDMYLLFKQLFIIDSTSDESLFLSSYKQLLTLEELLKDKDDFHYSLDKFRYVEKFTKEDIKHIITINEYCKKIEESDEKINGILPYIYGNVKLITSRLIYIYQMKMRYEFIHQLAQRYSFSSNLPSIIANIDPKIKNDVVYQKEGLSLPVIDLGKKNQSFLNILIDHAHQNNISPIAIFSVALIENNFGNGIITLKDDEIRNDVAFGPLQIKDSQFKKVMDNKSILDYPRGDRFFAATIAGIRHIAKFKEQYHLDLDFATKIPKLENFNRLNEKEKKIIIDFGRLSLYYSGGGSMLLKEALEGPTEKTQQYIHKLFSALSFYYYIEDPNVFKEGEYL